MRQPAHIIFEMGDEVLQLEEMLLQG